MKKEKDVLSEIKRLKFIKPTIPEMTGFGDSNYAAINAQINVLENCLDEDQIFDLFEGNDYALDNALGAMRWMHDEDDGESPSSGWKPLCRE